MLLQHSSMRSTAERAAYTRCVDSTRQIHEHSGPGSEPAGTRTGPHPAAAAVPERWRPGCGTAGRSEQAPPAGRITRPGYCEVGQAGEVSEGDPRSRPRQILNLRRVTRIDAWSTCL